VPAPGSLNTTYPPSQKSAMSPQYRQGLYQTKVRLYPKWMKMERSFPISLSVKQSIYSNSLDSLAMRIFNKDMALLFRFSELHTWGNKTDLLTVL